MHKHAGPELLSECSTLDALRTGEAVMAAGYRLPSRYGSRRGGGSRSTLSPRDQPVTMTGARCGVGGGGTQTRDLHGGTALQATVPHRRGERAASLLPQRLPAHQGAGEGRAMTSGKRKGTDVRRAWWVLRVLGAQHCEHCVSVHPVLEELPQGGCLPHRHPYVVAWAGRGRGNTLRGATV